MPIRQVIPKQQFDTGSIQTLNLEPTTESHSHRAARAGDLNWNPNNKSAHELSTIGGIAAPGTAAAASSWVAQRSTGNTSSTLSAHRVERRMTPARLSRVLVVVLPLAVLAMWIWSRMG